MSRSRPSPPSRLERAFIKMVNAAIVGLGRWGRRLVDSVQVGGLPKSEALRFTHGVARDLAPHAEYAKSQGLALLDSLDDALENAAIDAVVLATPHDVHVSQILKAGRAGKHVFVEKPLSLSARGAADAVGVMHEAGRVLAVGHNRRFLPAVAEIRRLVDSGALGRVVHVEGTFCNNSGLTYEPTMWRASERGSKASMTAMGIHILDLFVALCGRVNEVACTGKRIAMPVDVADVVRVSLDFEGGGTGYLSTMLSSPRQWRFQVYGTHGWALMRDEHLLDVADAHGKVTSREFAGVDTVQLELEAFGHAVMDRAAYPISEFELMHVPAVLEAILHSSDASGHPTAVSTLPVRLAKSV